MKRNLAALALLALTAASPAGAATMWDVVEGPQGAIKGAWAFPDGALDGNARMALPSGQALTYAVKGASKGAEYTFQRSGSSDLVACTYHGEVAPGSAKIVGSRLCGGVTSLWIATPH